jgi:acetyl esterase/lipase
VKINKLRTEHIEPDKHILACSIIRELFTNGSLQRIQTGYPSLIDLGDVVEVTNRNDYMPSSVVIYDDDNAAVFIEGASVRHYPYISEGWGTINQGGRANPFEHAWFGLAAETIMIANSTLFEGGQRNFFLFGHSAGGAIAAGIGYRLKTAGVAKTATVFTYGAPRPGNQVWANQLDRAIFLYRYFLAGDTVPYLPPHTDEDGLFGIFLSSREARSVNSFVQPPTGYVIASTGPIIRQEMPAMPTWRGNTSKLRVAETSLGLGNTEHRIGSYLDCWSSRRILPGFAVTGGVPEPDMPHVQTLRDRGREVEAAIPNLIFNVDEMIPGFSMKTREESLLLPKASFKRRKVGSIWVVKLRDDIVDIGPRKRAAGRKARAWNKAVPRENR